MRPTDYMRLFYNTQEEIEETQRVCTPNATAEKKQAKKEQQATLFPHRTDDNEYTYAEVEGCKRISFLHRSV